LRDLLIICAFWIPVYESFEVTQIWLCL